MGGWVSRKHIKRWEIRWLRNGAGAPHWAVATVVSGLRALVGIESEGLRIEDKPEPRAARVSRRRSRGGCLGERNGHAQADDHGFVEAAVERGLPQEGGYELAQVGLVAHHHRPFAPFRDEALDEGQGVPRR